MAVAPSIKAALAEANRLAPNRSRASDGTYGDAAHARRSSDHNPGARGLVHACDITHDPGDGFDCSDRAEEIRRRCQAGVERRVKYVIWNRRIFSADNRWAWRRYDGSNPHDKHMHISIHSTVAAENDTSPWWPAPQSPPPTPAPAGARLVASYQEEKLQLHRFAAPAALGSDGNGFHDVPNVQADTVVNVEADLEDPRVIIRVPKVGFITGPGGILRIVVAEGAPAARYSFRIWTAGA